MLILYIDAIVVSVPCLATSGLEEVNAVSLQLVQHNTLCTRDSSLSVLELCFCWEKKKVLDVDVGKDETEMRLEILGDNSVDFLPVIWSILIQFSNLIDDKLG